jgi:hypothetical protein
MRIAIALAAVALAACGSDAKSASNAVVDLDGDPVALLPAHGVGLANVDAKTIYASGSAGADIAKVAERLVPIGAEAGFVPSRDVDRVVIGVYTGEGADVAAIVKGRFDPGKIASVASSNTVTAAGGALTTSHYSGHDVYTMGTVGFVPLTSATILAGTDWGIRRTLDKIQTGHAARDFPQWMIDTIETKWAAVAFTANFMENPLASAAIGSTQLPFLVGMRSARVLADFNPPGMNVAGRLSYNDPSQASGAAQMIHQADDWNKFFGSLLGNVQNLDVQVEGNDVTAKAGVDDTTLKTLVMFAGSLIPQPH